jgi:hypothetical protein
MPIVNFKTKDEIPEGLREHAKEENGVFAVDLSPTVKLAEFRDKNIQLMREKDALAPKATAYDELTKGNAEGFAEELTKLRDTFQQVKDGKLTAKADIEDEVKRRTAEQAASLQAQIAAKSKEAETAKAEVAELTKTLHRSIIDREVTNAVLAGDSGVNPELLRYVLADAYGVFEVTKEGALVAKKDGAVWYGADGASSISPKEWLGKLLEATPSLAKPSVGGGAVDSVHASKVRGGMSEEAFNKLSPSTRRTMARSAQG